MEIKKATYLQSAGSISGCPNTTLPEMAFIGRSNVGKSSLINFITGQNNLALTSSHPGKTKSINHFFINESWYLVDLPGYGYAKVSQTERVKWIDNTWDYLKERKNLINTFVLIDANILPQKKDIEFINDLGAESIPFCIVFTKCDKSKPNIISDNIEAFMAALSEYWEELPKHIQTSSLKKVGYKELTDYLGYCIQQAKS
jgi:GTP-binding protein